MSETPNVHVMVDLETWSTDNDALIWAIGAAKFDPMLQGVEDSFYVVIDPSSWTPYKRHVDPATLGWWMHPDRAEARKQLVEAEGQVDAVSALEGFRLWFGNESLPVWGNGASFDNVILSGAYKAIGDTPPWAFWHDRCYRTIKSAPGAPDMARVGTYHNALDDAISQALHLQNICEALGVAL